LADAAVYDPKELEEDVDLDVEQRRRVLDMFYRLEAVDHYALLGVARTADKKTVKRAYYDLTAHFHPDRFFRKRLGSFKAKMEAVFARITRAHDVLTDKVQRTEYDAYIGDVERARGIEAMLKDVLAEVERAEKAVEQAVPKPPEPRPSQLPPGAPGAPARPPAPTPPPVVAPSRAPAVAAPSKAPGALSAQDEAARRAMLARRLLGGGRLPPHVARPSAAPATAPATAATRASTGPHESAAAAMEALKRRYEDRIGQARRFQAKKYTENAQAAVAQNDWVAASNAYRVAASLLPEDAELKRLNDEAQAQADSILSESYERQASYEEKSQKWDDAARSWRRVADARPTAAKPQERAANAIMKAGGDLRDAVALARRAVELEPNEAHYRATLASAYLAAGLTLNAKREAETAAQISPHDGTIQALMKKIGKQA
jgi:curved DNA-binding protein CbpA